MVVMTENEINQSIFGFGHSYEFNTRIPHLVLKRATHLKHNKQ